MAEVGALVALVALLVGQAPVCQGEEDGPQTYPMSFMNITTDRNETGIIQIYAYSINRTNFLLEANNDSFNQFKELQASQGSNMIYNFTPPFGSILRQNDPSTVETTINNFGIVASSNDPLYVIGVKSDKGTTDAYRSLPLVDTSTEYFIAGWPREVEHNFLASIMIMGVEDDTCIEIYKIFNGNNYVRLQSQMGGVGKYQVYRYFAGTELDETGSEVFDGLGEDVTGYFINSTKPVGVNFGHECAWVPTAADLFCDYMVEQIPPVSQLGMYHVVPPIAGRSSAAGYIVRVVPTQPGDTVIKYLGLTATRVRGGWLEFDQKNSGLPTYVECSQKCLVMQYNKGYLTVDDDVPTDPFMQLVPADDRYTAGAGFATANFCLEKDMIINFDNWVSLVTFANYKDSIRFDDQPLTSLGATWNLLTVGTKVYAWTAFRVSHGFHYINLLPGTYGSFSCHVYGHSTFKDSSSAYGVSVNYNITGKPVSDTYEKGMRRYTGGTAEPNSAAQCETEADLTGDIVKNGFGDPARYPFTLRASIAPPISMGGACQQKYKEDLMKLLQDFSRKINMWICKSQNCSYIGGFGVAIEYELLRIDWIGTGGVFNAVEIYVVMMGSPTVGAKDFAQCRADIMTYMYEFINWPPAYTRDLIASRAAEGCPWPIPFTQPRFIEAVKQCPAY